MRILVFTTAFSLWAATAAFAFDAPTFWKAQWPKTDFSTASVDLAEVLSGGPPKDGIPAISDPKFQAISGETKLKPAEAVVSIDHAGESRAYPVRYLMWHEIVNDEIAGQPIAVTYCPLCNSAIVFDRNVGDKTLSFGVSGMLRNSDMIMYDRETESWWQQFTGEAIVGKLVGAELHSLPARLESWESFSTRKPKGVVMKKPENYLRRYGENPYVGYDTLSKPWLYDGEPPSSGLPMMARIVRVGERAWPMARIVEDGSLTEEGVTLSWAAGQSSALDAASVGGGRDVGNVEVADSKGNLITHEVTFAFVFQAFHPNGKWMMGDE